MPAAKPPDLSPTQTGEARDLFVVGLLETPEIADRLGVSHGSVRKAKTTGGWVVARRRYGSQEEVQARRKAHLTKMAEAREAVELGCAELAQLRIAIRLKEAALLEALAKDPSTPVLGRGGLSSALGPASQDVTSGRLAVGLSTEKADTANQGEAFIAEMDRIFGPARKTADNREMTEAAEPPQETPPDGTPPG